VHEGRRMSKRLLPLHLFASVTFNAREQCLVLRR